nr:MAG TPA: hypothetical protein [Caudoviricetes sp.]DAP33637.1 MAG TPA: hypothetical protein [Caudoviricetes sp.]
MRRLRLPHDMGKLVLKVGAIPTLPKPKYNRKET